MIPILYEYNETEFTSNGIGRLTDCVECRVHEGRNDVFECQFDYPITGHLFSEIYEGRIIACTHDDTGDVQPFDIYSHSAPMNGIVTFYAHHISYRLGEITVKPFTATTCAEAILGLKNNSITTNPFTVWTDKSTTGDYELKEPSVFRAMLGGTEGSLLDIYGTGEYEFDKWAVKLYLHRGTDTNVEIRYGKNLADIQEDIDYTDCYTAVVPYWTGQDDDREDVFVHLDEWVVNSGQTTYGGRAIVVPLDLSSDFDEEPTRAELRSKAISKLNDSEPWIPSTSIKVDFVQLWQTEEYKDYAPLQRVRLCDTVSVYHPDMGISAYKSKVVDVVYNVLLERFDEMTLGEPQTSFDELIKAENKKAVEQATARIKRILNNNNFVLQNELTEAIENATSLITGGLGGYVVIGYNANGKPEELLIMDDDDINQAQNVWRWNVNGLGFSSTGYNGTYRTAITADGKIVADFITAGVLTGNIIRAGILTDVVGRNYWNLETGEFRLAAQTKIGTSTDTLADLAKKTSTIADVDVEYASGTSQTTAPTSGWSTTAPAWEEGKYIWQRTKTTNGAGSVTYSTPTCIQGAKGEAGTSVTILGSYSSYADLKTAHPTGNDGDAYLVNGDLYVWSSDDSDWVNVGNIQGPSGTDGVGIGSTTITYGVSASGSTEPSSWQSTVPSVSQGQWLWVKTVFTYTDPSSTQYTIKSKSYVGTDGEDGKSVYVQSASKVDGVTTVVLTDGTTPTTITIADGEDGNDGHAGANGYVHIAWATSSDGSQGFSTTVSAGKTYLGTYTDNTQADSQTYSDYSWSLIKGADGANGEDGADGVGVSSIVEQYYLSTSDMTQTGGSWSTTQPAWQSGRYIWTRSIVYWTEGDPTTTTPVLAQAINSANQNASDAKTTAQTVSDWISTTYESDKSDLQNQIDEKIDTWYQSSDPSTGWTAEQKADHVGDLWYRTTDSTTHRFNGTIWEEQEVPDAVFDSIDGKSTIFYGSTSGTYTDVSEGDYLVDPTDGCTYRYNGSTWVKVTDYNTAISDYDASQDQQAVFNKLTNNGETQGIYLSGGKLYINASYIASGTLVADYIKGGTLSVGGSDNGNGVIKVYNASGTEIGSWTKDGLVTTGSFRMRISGYGSGKYVYADMGSFTVYDGLNNYTRQGFRLTGNNSNSQEIYLVAQNSTSTASHIYATKNLYLHGCSSTSNLYTDVWLGSTSTQIRFQNSSGGNFMSMNASRTYFGCDGSDGTSWQGMTLTGSLSSKKATLNVNGPIVGTSKSNLVKTDNYDKRLLFCYEMPTAMYGDIGEGVTDEDGICVVDIDDIFSEVSRFDVTYYVFLQKRGDGDLWVSQKEHNYFVVEGTPNTQFDWEVKVRQKENGDVRLEEYDRWEDANTDHTDLMDESLNILEKEFVDYMKEQEERIYETA